MVLLVHFHKMCAVNQVLNDQPITKTRSIAFVLLGVAALVLKRYYAGPLQGVVWEYGGNVTASFAVYFSLLI